MSTEQKRTFEPGRYSKANALFMDMAKGEYRNSYTVADRGSDTGLFVVSSGNRKASRTVIVFNDAEYPTLREAIFAYEDSLKVAADA